MGEIVEGIDGGGCDRRAVRCCWRLECEECDELLDRGVVVLSK